MADMKYALFLGCMIPYREGSYEVSARRVAKALNLELVDMPDANCCGLPLDPASHDMALAMATRNLCIAEKMGLKVMALCNGCTGFLKKADKRLKDDRDLRKEMNATLAAVGMQYQGKTEVKHIANVLTEDVGFEKLKTYVKRPLTGLTVAPYTGCHIFRPSKVMGVPNPLNPQILNDLVGVTGAKVIEYVDQFQCCGASEGSIDNKIPVYLAREKLRNAKSAGADVMVTLCPTCHQTLDGNQPLVERTFQEHYGLPVLHYTQLLGLAMGMSPEELAMNELRVKAVKALETLNA
jgi:heterodisulfide reductase subunit B